MISRSFKSRILLLPVVAVLIGFWGIGTVRAEKAFQRNYRIKSDSKEVEGAGSIQVTASARYDKPVEEVWALLSQYDRFYEYIPRVVESRKMGSRQGVEQIQVIMDLPWPLPDLTNVLAVHRDDQRRRMTWELVEGNMKVNTGSAELKKSTSKTNLTVEAKVDPGLLLPRWMVGWAARRFVPKVLTAIGNELHSDSTSKDFIKKTHKE